MKFSCAPTCYKLANSLVKLNRINDAIIYYKNAIQISPDYTDIDKIFNNDAIILNTLSIAYAEVGEFNKAIQTSQKALELAQKNGEQAAAREIEKHLQLYKAKISNGNLTPKIRLKMK